MNFSSVAAPNVNMSTFLYQISTPACAPCFLDIGTIWAQSNARNEIEYTDFSFAEFL